MAVSIGSFTSVFSLSLELEYSAAIMAALLALISSFVAQKLVWEAKVAQGYS